MLNLNDKTKCCACRACEQACPKNAISMNYDEEGFLYPSINKDLCIDCSICEKVCPVLLSGNNKNESLKKAYALRTKNESALRNSTSGGIAYELSKKVLENGGVVFGVCFDEKFFVHHEAITDISQLHRLQGSKYVQSNTLNTYKEAQDYLKEGRQVYFTGTPCQIEGLISFLKKDYDNLITQDTICHGVPSPKLWERYIEEMGYSDADDIIFRDKEKGWETKSDFVVKWKNKETRYPFYKDIYYHFFGNNFSLRPICYECPFKTGYKKSDVTCADLWGISKLLPEGKSDDKGMSLLLVHSDKGQALLNSISDSVESTEISYDAAIAENMMALKSVVKPSNRAEFFEDIKKYSFKKVYKKYRPKDPPVLAIKKKLYPLKQFLTGNK